MEMEHTTDSWSADDLLDDALTQQTEASPKRRADFQQRLADYEATAESNPNELAGVLTFVLSDLLDLASRMGEALRETPATLDDFDQIDSRLVRYLQVMRQADRYANLELRIEEARAREGNANKTNRSKGQLGMPQAQRLRTRAH